MYGRPPSRLCQRCQQWADLSTPFSALVSIWPDPHWETTCNFASNKEDQVHICMCNAKQINCSFSLKDTHFAQAIFLQKNIKGGGEGGTVGQDPHIKIYIFFLDLKIAQKGPKPRKFDD